MTVGELVREEVRERVVRLPLSAPREIAASLPPLASGDRLTRREFERRYAAMPHIKKAELLEGVVHMPSPVSVYHSRAHAQVLSWLGVYCAVTPGIDINDNVTVRLDTRNEVQPDASLRLEPDMGGHSRISIDGYIEGAPELIVEIAGSSAAYDLHDKRLVYQRNGVREYLVWQVYEPRIDWWVWRAGEYAPLAPDAAGLLRSEVFPGLWLAVDALLAGDLARVLAELQRGIATAEHAAFMARLRGQGDER